MYIDIVIFDPHYWIFSLGISLNRYEEHDETHSWVRKELDLGLLLLSLRLSFIKNKKKREI
jgi:hypothetical protein